LIKSGAKIASLRSPAAKFKAVYAVWLTNFLSPHCFVLRVSHFIALLKCENVSDPSASSIFTAFQFAYKTSA
jgi:hypothetical protein